MERLAGSDAGFLFVEGPTMTSTCVDLAVLAAPAEGRAPLTVDALTRHIEARLDTVPSFRWRLEEVPFGLHHPVWVDDPDFDLGYHVRHATLPAPGGDAELDAHMAATLPVILDQRHPLWRVTLVDGLAGGRQALVFCFHHCMADGAALVTSLDGLFGAPPGRPAPPWAPAPAPARARLLLDGLADLFRAWLAVPLMLVRTITRFRAVEARRKAAPTAIPRAMGDAPPSVLNRSFTDDRVFGRTRIPIEALRRAKAAAPDGTAMSDVILTVVSGAIRAYLLARDQLPDRPLVVNVPVANDPPGAAPRQHGNRFANFFSSLATDVEGPVERLAAVTAASAESKVQLDILGRDTLPAWLDRIPPAVGRPAAHRLAARLSRPGAAPDFSVLVSNVRVPATDLGVDGQRFEELTMSGPVADGAGLNVTLVGFRDHVHVAIVANPSALDDPAELAGRMHESLAELLGALGATGESEGPPGHGPADDEGDGAVQAPAAGATGAPAQR